MQPTKAPMGLATMATVPGALTAPVARLNRTTRGLMDTVVVTSATSMGTATAQQGHGAANSGDGDEVEGGSGGLEAASEPPPPRSSSSAALSASRARRIPQAMVVLAQVQVPPDSPPQTPLVELLQRLMPEQCASASAAKRVLRRRLILRVSPPETDAQAPPAAGPPGAEASAPGVTPGEYPASDRSPAPETPAAVPGSRGDVQAAHPQGREADAEAAGCSGRDPGGGAATAGGSGGVGDRPHPRGVQVSVLDTASPYDVLQLLARSGTGFMGWVGPSGTRGRGPGQPHGANGDRFQNDPRGAEGLRDAGSSGDAGDGGGGVGGEARQQAHQRWQRQRQDGPGQLGEAAPGTASAAAGFGGAERLAGLPVAFEDEHLAVIIKPPGIDTQGSGVGSVQGRLKYCLKPTTLIGALNRPQQVHRLDAPTGGLLLVAKTHAALRTMAADLHHRRMSKRYCSLVKGLRSGSGTIDMPLSGKPCVTHYEVAPLPPSLLALTTATTAAVARVANSSANPTEPPAGCSDSSTADRPHDESQPQALAVTAAEGVQQAVELAGMLEAGPERAGSGFAVPSRLHGFLTKVHLWPHTGRTHQLRKHMAYTGTPLLGEPRYRGVRSTADPRVGQGPSEVPSVIPQTPQQPRMSADPTPKPSTNDSPDGSEVDTPRGFPGRDVAAGSVRVPGGTGSDEKEEDGPEGESRDEEDPSGTSSGEDEAFQACLPPVDRDWVMAVAAAAAELPDAGDVLSDGARVSLCLWAVELRFRHPISGRKLRVDISGWADALYDELLRRELVAV